MKRRRVSSLWLCDDVAVVFFQCHRAAAVASCHYGGLLYNLAYEAVRTLMAATKWLICT